MISIFLLILKVIKTRINPSIESQIEENNIKIKNKSNKKKLVRVLIKLVKITKDRWTNSKKKKLSIKLSEKAIPNKLSKNNNILKCKMLEKLSDMYKKKFNVILTIGTGRIWTCNILINSQMFYHWTTIPFKIYLWQDLNLQPID